jgi:hypothetical protein
MIRNFLAVLLFTLFVLSVARLAYGLEFKEGIGDTGVPHLIVFLESNKEFHKEFSLIQQTAAKFCGDHPDGIVFFREADTGYMEALRCL